MSEVTHKGGNALQTHHVLGIWFMYLYFLHNVLGLYRYFSFFQQLLLMMLLLLLLLPKMNIITTCVLDSACTRSRYISQTKIRIGVLKCQY